MTVTLMTRPVERGERAVLPDFKDWLKRQVETAGVSYRQASLDMGMNPTAVSEYIRGYRIPRPEACMALAKYFGVSENYVLAVAGHLTPRDSVLGDVPPERQAIYEIVDDVPLEKLPVLQEVMRALVDAWHERPTNKGGAT